MKVQRCKGFRDLAPDEMSKFRLVEKTFRDCCLSWGYREVRTPTLEYLYLFTATGTLTPDKLNRTYSFLDWDGWSGERVVLRPDGTIPVARLYIDSMAEKGRAKLFYVTNVFAFEETGQEMRERWQCGVELIGQNSPVADVELISLALDVLQKLGLGGIEVRLSHAGLVRALLARLELSPQEQVRIFDQLLDGDTGALAGAKTDKPELVEAMSVLLDLKGKSSEFLKNIRALFSRKLPELEPALDNFIGITDLLEALGYHYRLDLASGRGFEYYTGVIFHLFITKKNIGGGGRYDALIPLMCSRDTPAAGFALYLDSLMKLVKPEALAEPVAKRILVRIAPQVMKEGLGVAGLLREAGYVAELALGGEEASGYGFILDVKDGPPRFVLSDQLKRRKFKLKTADDVLAWLESGEDAA